MKYFQLEDSELGTGARIPAGTPLIDNHNRQTHGRKALLLDIWKFEGRFLNTFCFPIISDGN